MKKMMIGGLLAAGYILGSAGYCRGQCPDPFISEIVEGVPGAEAIEIHNPNEVSVDLSSYYLRCFPNGASITVGFLQLSGILAPGETTVVYSAAITGAGMELTGDDAYSLEWIGAVPPYVYVADVFGEPGVDPGSGWTDDAGNAYTDAGGAVAWTADHTLRRKATVSQGIHACCPSPFDVTLEWDTLPIGTVSGLGSHSAACSTSLTETESKPNEPGMAWTQEGLVVTGATGAVTLDLFSMDGKHLMTIEHVPANGPFLPRTITGAYLAIVRDPRSGSGARARVLVVD